MDPAPLLDDITAIAHRAGEAILAVYRRDDVQITEKDDRSPLTEADLAAHALIVAALQELTPAIPVLSEESATISWETRRLWSRFWLVDPLDGTKEFLKRNGEFTVNIALIEDASPVLGVVHAPAIGVTYRGVAGRPAERETGAGWAPIRPHSAGPVPRVVASRSHAGPALATFLTRLGDHVCVSMGSSLKLCLVAAGDADCYPRLGPTMEWDTAAAHAVCAAAGCIVFSAETFGVLRYNKPDLHNPFFAVAGSRSFEWPTLLEGLSA